MFNVYRMVGFFGSICLVAAFSGCATEVDDATATTSQEQEQVAMEEETASVDSVPLTPLDRPDVVPSQETPADSAEIPRLGVSDPAPPLQLSAWSLGEPIEELETGQVYVVEFWATWCGPCLAGMPHMSAVQESYGDEVKIVGITREESAVVEDFLDQEQSAGTTWRDVIKYRLAVDDAGATNDAYMRAAGQNGIPTAFIVGKDGVVEWIGHPGEMDQPLEQIVNDTWDRAAAVAEFQKFERLNTLSQQFSALLRGASWQEALKKLGEIEQEVGETSQVLMAKMQLLGNLGRKEELGALREKFIEAAWDDAAQLFQIASNTVNTSDGAADALASALKAAQRAVELTNEENPIVLDTLARVYYEQGDLDSAIEWQKKAVEQAHGQPEVGQTLKRYEAEKAGAP